MWRTTSVMIASVVTVWMCTGLSGCAVEPGPDDSEPAVSSIESASTSMSFTATCFGPFQVAGNADGFLWFAGADSCRRINGTWSMQPRWSSGSSDLVCYTDIANCNGVLKCGRC